MPERMTDASEIVARQYSKWVYPRPIMDLDEHAASGPRPKISPAGDPSFVWPEGAPTGPLRILVAGCGSSQAAAIAYFHPEAAVVGLDLSEPSLAHNKFLAERHELQNLRLEHRDLRSVAESEQQFDFIYCTGVLHHLGAPDDGVRALRAVLAPHGVAAVLIYGFYGRLGVYMLQDSFRKLGLGQDQQDVASVRQTLNALPWTHPVQSYIKTTSDLGYDAGVVDSFLHNVDHAYTVESAMELLESNGMAFQSWLFPHLYSVEGRGYPNDIVERALGLPEREHWTVAELLSAPKTHFFLARRNDSPGPFRVDFNEGDVARYRPVWRSGVALETGDDGRVQVRRGNGNAITLAPNGARLARQVDGARNIESCWRNTNRDGGQPLAWTPWAVGFFRRMWRLGVMAFRLADAPGG